MKKLMTLMIVILALAIVIPALPVAATTMDTETAATTVDRSTRQAQRQEILDLRIQIQSNRASIMSQISDNRALRQELKAKIEASRDTIPASTVEQLQALHEQVITLAEAIQATKGDIVTIKDQLRAMNPRTDFDAIKAATLSIIQIQEQRLNDLQAINALLQQMLALNFEPIVIN